MDRNENYRRVLKAGLRRRGMTQKQLGNLVGLSQHTISDYVCGKSVPAVGDAAAMAKVLSFSLDATYDLRENEGMIQPSAMEWTLLQLFQQVPPISRKMCWKCCVGRSRSRGKQINGHRKNDIIRLFEWKGHFFMKVRAVFDEGERHGRFFRLFKNKKGERRFLCYNSNNGHGRKGSICGRRIILRHTLTAMTRS